MLFTSMSKCTLHYRKIGVSYWDNEGSYYEIFYVMAKKIVEESDKNYNLLVLNSDTLYTSALSQTGAICNI